MENNRDEEVRLNGGINGDVNDDSDIINEIINALNAGQLDEVSVNNQNNAESPRSQLNRPDAEVQLFRFDNSTCYICNGFYGPCFEDQICSTCHAFLHPNIPPDLQFIADSDDQGDDGDSGNDEPSDIAYRRNGSGDHAFEMHHNIVLPMPSVPPVQIEALDRHLRRITEPQYEVAVNIENLPTEVMMQVFEHLDDISLWSVGQVSVRLNEILNMYIRADRWRNFTLLRWPLFSPMRDDVNWYNAYSTFMESCACMKCILQMASQDHWNNVEENSWRTHRLRSELRVMRMDPLEGIQALPLDALCRYWQASIAGPNDSPYEGGLFYLFIQIPQTYPMSPPVVRFITKIFHPNISRHGDIGIDSIQHNWSLALTISKVLLSVQSLLTDPYCDICMEPEVGAMYVRDRASYDQQVRLWTQKYAMVDLRSH